MICPFYHDEFKDQRKEELVKQYLPIYNKLNSNEQKNQIDPINPGSDLLCKLQNLVVQMSQILN